MEGKGREETALAKEKIKGSSFDDSVSGKMIVGKKSSSREAGLRTFPRKKEKIRSRKENKYTAVRRSNYKRT